MSDEKDEKKIRKEVFRKDERLQETVRVHEVTLAPLPREFRPPSDKKPKK